MLTTLVMTIIGPDRTGLVESVARAIAEHGGNWLESRMSRLGGEFAGILRIELPADKRQPLLDALQKLQGAGLTVVVRPGDTNVPAAAGRQTKFEIIGHDRPGIVREISSVLTRSHVNVEEFASEVISAPMSGETLFKANPACACPKAAISPP